MEHFRFVQALEDENTVAKQTIPSPAQFYEQMIFPMNAETTNKIYPNREELLEDVARSSGVHPNGSTTQAAATCSLMTALGAFA